MDRVIKITNAFFLILLFSYVWTSIAKGQEFPSGLNLSDLSCMGNPSDKWEFGLQPELWYVRTKLQYGNGTQYVDGPMPGVSLYSTKKYSKGSITILGGLRYGEFNSYGDYSYHGTQNRFSSEMSQLQSELKASTPSQKF